MAEQLDGSNVSSAQNTDYERVKCSCTWVIHAETGVYVSTHHDADCPAHGVHTAWWANVMAKAREIAERIGLTAHIDGSGASPEGDT